MLPPTLHLLQGTLVRIITTCDHFLEMAVLRLNHLISGGSVVRQITWSTHFFAGHCLHKARFLSRDVAVNDGEFQRMSPLISTPHDVDDCKSDVPLPASPIVLGPRGRASRMALVSAQHAYKKETSAEGQRASTAAPSHSAGANEGTEELRCSNRS
jgi:hypothetical protein